MSPSISAPEASAGICPLLLITRKRIDHTRAVNKSVCDDCLGVYGQCSRCILGRDGADLGRHFLRCQLNGIICSVMNFTASLIVQLLKKKSSSEGVLENPNEHRGKSHPIKPDFIPVKAGILARDLIFFNAQGRRLKRPMTKKRKAP